MQSFMPAQLQPVAVFSQSAYPHQLALTAADLAFAGWLSYLNTCFCCLSTTCCHPGMLCVWLLCLIAECGCVKASDNTRAVSERAGESWLLPADQTRRVILCSGQIYYRLFHARRARQIRDVILVRLEQIAPFPHDLVTQVPAQPLHKLFSLLSAPCNPSPLQLLKVLL